MKNKHIAVLLLILFFCTPVLYSRSLPLWNPQLPDKHISYFEHQKATVAYRYWNRESGTKTLLFLYGFGGNLHMADYFIRMLPDDYRVLAIDYPGHGYSPAAGQKLSLDDISHLLEDLLLELGENEIYLAGYSLGGTAALHLYGRLGSRVKKLVLWNTLPYFTYNKSRARLFDLIEKMLRFDYTFTVNRIAIPLLKDTYFSRDLIKTARTVAGYNNPASVLTIFSLLSEYDARPVLKTIECPVLVLHSGKDPLVPAGPVREYSEIIPNSKRLLFLRHGHLSMVSDRITFVNQIHDFLK